jgi:tyrosine decarboxylase/aspartate 1-decarboxylase
LESLDEIISRLKEWYSRTPKHFEGTIFGSMTTWPHPIGVYAYQLFIHINGNDPVLFPIVQELEKELLAIIGSLYGSRYGLFTSGGTESNILALFVARRVSRGKNNVVVAPSTVHASIDKACQLMGTRLVKIPVNPLSPIDPDILEKHIKEHNPFAVVVTAGTTETGVVDRVKDVSEIALKHDVYLHVDAAFGGLLIPFLHKHGVIDTDLTFYPGVSSISVDLHKNGRAPIPSSLLFFRSETYVDKACFEMNYLPSGVNCGLLGTRPGASLVASWAVVKAIGLEGYEKQALAQQDTALYLFKELDNREFIEVFKPVLPIVAWRSKLYDYEVMIKKLFNEGIFLYKSPSLKAARVVVMPHVTRENIDALLKALDKIHSGRGYD